MITQKARIGGTPIAKSARNRKPVPRQRPAWKHPAGRKRKAEEMRKITLLKMTMFTVLLAVLLPAASSFAQTEIQVNYTWTAPTTGTPVDHYVVQHSVNGGHWTQVGTVPTTTPTP